MLRTNIDLMYLVRNDCRCQNGMKIVAQGVIGLNRIDSYIKFHSDITGSSDNCITTDISRNISG
jgi:hypothetical protein